jgi:hypothetical protein
MTKSGHVFGGWHKALSRFIQVWFRGFPDIVTADHLANMEIPPIDTTRTPIGKPATRPEFHTEVKDTRLLSIPFKDQGERAKAIPYGMNGAMVSWGIFDTPPANFKMLGNADLATRSPCLLHPGNPGGPWKHRDLRLPELRVPYVPYLAGRPYKHRAEHLFRLRVPCVPQPALNPHYY